MKGSKRTAAIIGITVAILAATALIFYCLQPSLKSQLDAIAKPGVEARVLTDWCSKKGVTYYVNSQQHLTIYIDSSPLLGFESTDTYEVEIVDGIITKVEISTAVLGI